RDRRDDAVGHQGARGRHRLTPTRRSAVEHDVAAVVPRMTAATSFSASGLGAALAEHGEARAVLLLVDLAARVALAEDRDGVGAGVAPRAGAARAPAAARAAGDEDDHGREEQEPQQGE